jgi:ParB family transcriptional regulator, chromosome partitioning protein
MNKIEKVTIKDFVPDLPLAQIVVADENVRHTKRKVGLDELKQSIETFGLIHPVIVIKDKDKYKLIVGQRRYLAFKDLRKRTIPALIINSLNTTAQKVVSLGENIQRRALPYADTIAVCDALYSQYSGSKTERIRKIAADLGISDDTVSKYLGYRLIPKEVQNLVEEGKLSRKLAQRITTSLWPDEKKIIEIAKRSTRMTTSERERAISIGRSKPEASAEEIATEAKKPKLIFEIVIPLDQESVDQLEKIAKGRQTEVKDLILDLIQDLLQ